MDKEKEVFGRLNAKLPVPKSEGLLRKDVAPIVGVVGRTIQHYTDIGLIVPKGPLSGKGTKRRYSKQDIFEILLIQALLKHGFTLSNVKPIINATSEKWIKNPKSKTLVIYTHKGSNFEYDIHLIEQDGLNLEINTKKFESILILDLSDIIKKIKTL